MYILVLYSYFHPREFTHRRRRVPNLRQFYVNGNVRQRELMTRKVCPAETIRHIKTLIITQTTK